MLREMRSFSHLARAAEAVLVCSCVTSFGAANRRVRLFLQGTEKAKTALFGLSWLFGELIGTSTEHLYHVVCSNYI